MNELSVFANWRSEYIEVHTTMVTLGYTPVEMYYVLRSLLGGKAKQMIMVKEPNADTYQKSIDLLNDAFYSKALHVRDIVYRLKMLPVMDPSSAAKNQLWKTEAFNLMIQLSEMTQDSQDELKFLLFSEILLPKLNSEANKLWEKKITDENNISDEAHLGHTLGMDDLKKVIAKSTQILQQRELNKFYNGKKLPSNSESGKKDDDKKKSEKKHEKEDYLSHSTTLTNERQKTIIKRKAEAEMASLEIQALLMFVHFLLVKYQRQVTMHMLTCYSVTNCEMLLQKTLSSFSRITNVSAIIAFLSNIKLKIVKSGQKSHVKKH